MKISKNVLFKLTELLAADLQLAALFLFQFFVLIPYAERRCCTATRRITFFSMTLIFANVPRNFALITYLCHSKLALTALTVQA